MAWRKERRRMDGQNGRTGSDASAWLGTVHGRKN